MPSRFLEDIPRELTTGSWRDDRGSQRQRETTWDQPGGGTTVTIDDQPQGSQYRAGQNVRHDAFGEGVVLEVRAQGDDAIVTVNFEEGGEKRLLASFAPMQVLD